MRNSHSTNFWLKEYFCAIFPIHENMGKIIPTVTFDFISDSFRYNGVSYCDNSTCLVQTCICSNANQWSSVSLSAEIAFTSYWATHLCWRTATLHSSLRRSGSLHWEPRMRTSRSSPPWVHCDVMTWKPIPHYWPFVKGIHGSSVVPLTKGSAMWSFDIFFVVSVIFLQ